MVVQSIAGYAVLNGVLWVLRTGAQWQELPWKYLSYETCHRRFQQWMRRGKLECILRVLAEELHAPQSRQKRGTNHRSLDRRSERLNCYY
jgi:transposase